MTYHIHSSHGSPFCHANDYFATIKDRNQVYNVGVAIRNECGIVDNQHVAKIILLKQRIKSILEIQNFIMIQIDYQNSPPAGRAGFISVDFGSLIKKRTFIGNWSSSKLRNSIIIRSYEIQISQKINKPLK